MEINRYSKNNTPLIRNENGWKKVLCIVIWLHISMANICTETPFSCVEHKIGSISMRWFEIDKINLTAELPYRSRYIIPTQFVPLIELIL